MTDLFSEYFSKALGLFWFIYHRLAAAFEFLLANWVYITIVLALAAGYFLFHEYRQWQKNWLSGLIEEKIRELRRKRQRVWFENLRPFSVQNAYRISRFSAFRSMQRIEIYFESAPRQLKDFYFPSWTSFIFISVVFLCFFLLPPLIYSRLSLKAFGDVFEPLQNGETVKKIFGGLIVIAVGLIIFVAEFIRDSKNAERKRVLLQISNLWPLTLAVTIFPLGYLAGELTGLIVALVVLMSSFAIYAFARILRNLLDADAQEKNVRALLKTRIRSLIMESARERLGNNILLQRLGPDQDIKINYSVSRSWLQNGASSYIFVHHPQTGGLAT